MSSFLKNRINIRDLKNTVLRPSKKTAGCPVFVDSLPKSGTHLLAKALNEFPGFSHSGVHLERKSIAKFVDPAVDYPVEGREDINVYTDLPWIERLLKTIRSGQFITAHFKYNRPLHDVLDRLGFKILLMVRDPRDVVVSWADFIARQKNHLLYPYFSKQDPDYRIMCGIMGESSEKTKTRRQPGIAELLTWHVEWKTKAYAHLVQFEQLIGEKGGGSRDVQLDVLQKLCDLLEINGPPHFLDDIADNLFGGTATFNKGEVGRWRTRFNDEHRAIFKEHAGNLLIEIGYEKDLNW